MARALGVSEALAGQAVTATAVVAFFAGLLAAVVTRGPGPPAGADGVLGTPDRVEPARGRGAPSLPLLLLARVLLGSRTRRVLEHGDRGGDPARAAGHGAARARPWCSAACRSRPSWRCPSAATSAALYGWRVVFLLAAGVGVVTLLVQMAALPRLANLGAARLGTLLDVLRRRGIGLGMVCVVLIFTGHFGLFTYLRPFLERVGGANIQGIALTLMGFGLANFAGTLLAGFMLERSLRLTLALMPLLIAAAGLGLAGLHTGLPVHTSLVAVWGLGFGTIPVAWSTWLARAVPDETESGGGLIVAAVQLAITFGAAGGGAIYALAGVAGVFATGGVLMLATSAIIFASIPGRTPGPVS